MRFSSAADRRQQKSLRVAALVGIKSVGSLKPWGAELFFVV